jgi:hypothetical protein
MKRSGIEPCTNAFHEVIYKHSYSTAALQVTSIVSKQCLHLVSKCRTEPTKGCSLLICVKVARSGPSTFIIVIAEQSKEGCYDLDGSPN